MALPEVEGGGTPPVWRVDANILNKQSQTADKGWSSSSVLSEMLTNPHRKNTAMLRTFSVASDLAPYVAQTGMSHGTVLPP